MKFSDTVPFNNKNKKFIPNINEIISLFKNEIVCIDKIDKLKRTEDYFEKIDECHNYDDIKNKLKQHFINFSEEYNEKLKFQIIFDDDQIYFYTNVYNPSLNIAYLKDIRQFFSNSESYHEDRITFSFNIKYNNNNNDTCIDFYINNLFEINGNIYFFHINEEKTKNNLFNEINKYYINYRKQKKSFKNI